MQTWRSTVYPTTTIGCYDLRVLCHILILVFSWWSHRPSLFSSWYLLDLLIRGTTTCISDSNWFLDRVLVLIKFLIILLTELLKWMTHLSILTDFDYIESKVRAFAIPERLEQRGAAISASHWLTLNHTRSLVYDMHHTRLRPILNTAHHQFGLTVHFGDAPVRTPLFFNKHLFLIGAPLCYRQAIYFRKLGCIKAVYVKP